MKAFIKLSLVLIFSILSGFIVAQPTITSFSPSTGPVGTLVTINGTNLSNPTALNIAGTPAIVVSNTGTQLVAMVMPGATAGNVSITTAAGTWNTILNYNVTATCLPNTQQGDKLVGTGNLGAAQQGTSVAVSADGNTAVVGAPSDNGNIGAAWIYTRTGNTWTQQGNKLVANDYTGASRQGYSVAINADGNTIVVGAPFDNTAQGAVWVYTRSAGIWSQQGNKLVGTGAVYNAEQGVAVSISADGNTIVEGGSNDDAYIWGGNGAVWVFTRSSGNWSQQGNKLVGTGNNGYAHQGCSVALSADGNTLIEGGFQDGGYIVDCFDFSSLGAAWIFTRSGNTWTQQGNKLVGTGYTFGNIVVCPYVSKPDEGFSVAISADGNTALVGGPNDNGGIGATWVFTRSGVSWSQQGSPLTGSGISGMGTSVALSADGNYAILGAPNNNSGQGAFWSYRRSGNTWSQQDKLTGTGNIGAANQGHSVAISADGTTIISGGNIDNSNQGAAWVFTPICISPSIISFSPASGPVGTLVTINGTNLNNPTSLNIGGVPAIIISNTGTKLVAMVMPGATSGNISITTAGGSRNSSDTYSVTANCAPTVQQGNKLTDATLPANTTEIQGYGVAISADGNTAIVGGYGYNNEEGAAWIYVRNAGGTWLQQGNKLLANDMTGAAYFGTSVSISADGNTAIVGGPSDNGNVGAAWIFTRTGGVWTQQGNKLVGSGSVGSAQQGFSVALSADGNTAIIGGWADNSLQGATWVFNRLNNVWTQHGNKLVATGSSIDARQGTAVAISTDGKTIITGAPGDDNGGQGGTAYIFVLTGNNWVQEGNKLFGDNNNGVVQGHGVALSADGNTAIIGGGGLVGGFGTSWVFTRSNHIWTQQGSKLAGGGPSVSLSADGNTALLGGIQDNPFTGVIGQVFLYARSGGNWTEIGSPLVGSGGIGNSGQGGSVALSADGSTLIEGGPYDNQQAFKTFPTGASWIFTCSSSYDGGGGYVNSGGGGGVESKDLGDAIALRVYNRAVNNQNGKVDYNKLSVVGSNQTAQPTTFGAGTSSVTLASIMPDITKIGFVAYNSTPTDIVSITNAKEVIATDFTVNQQPKAVAFATKTVGALYDHTKPICDRLKGASLLDVQNITVGGFNFVQYTLKDENGITEYATSFSVGTKAGRNDFSLQSTWLSKDYVSDDVMYNFQLWAATPQLVNAMITDVLTKVQNAASIKPSGATNIPSTYVMSGSRKGTNLDLLITNTAAAGATGYFTLEDKAAETSNGTTATRQIPFMVNANSTSTVSIPMNDLYESTITMYVNGVMKDVVFMADGTWSTGYNANTSSVSSFKIINNTNRVYDSTEYAVLRDVQLQATSPDYISVFKLIRGGGQPADLSAYKALKFTASGGYTLRLTLVKNSIVNWADQYYVDIPLDNAQKEYAIALNSLVSAATKDKIAANDITTIVFAVMVGNGQSSAINSTFSNISFTKADPVYLAALNSKEIQLYPNPTVGKTFNCSFYSNAAQQLTLHVTDVMGRSIATKQVSAIKGLNTVPVELRSGNNGIHIISIDGANVKYNSKKIVVN